MTQTATQLNAKQVCAVFGISNMTLLSWRKGTKTRAPLPVASPKKSDPARAVRFNVSGIKAWAKKHAVAIEVAPETILADPNTGASVASAKSGPKPRATAKA